MTSSNLEFVPQCADGSILIGPDLQKRPALTVPTASTATSFRTALQMRAVGQPLQDHPAAVASAALSSTSVDWAGAPEPSPRTPGGINDPALANGENHAEVIGNPDGRGTGRLAFGDARWRQHAARSEPSGAVGPGPEVARDVRKSAGSAAASAIANPGRGWRTRASFQRALMAVRSPW